MAETKFTPGPWYLHMSFVRPSMGNVRGMWVRRILGENEEEWKDSRIALATGRADEDSSVVVAIGNLIAAAPELYAALEEIVENSCVYYKDSMDLYPQAIENARKALAKARGEEYEQG